jgi:Na+-translocating ferredoxin:NAD+ oxidoreductase RnfG subunit
MKKNEISEVRDRTADLWIKLLFFITTIAVGLVAYVGDRVIKGQDKMAEGQVEMIKEVVKLRFHFKSIDGRVSRVENSDKEQNVRINDNFKEINILKGRK